MTESCKKNDRRLEDSVVGKCEKKGTRENIKKGTRENNVGSVRERDR